MITFFPKNKNNISGVVQIALIVAMFIGLILAFVLGSSIAEGNLFQVALLGGTVGGIGVLLIMGKKYWYLLLITFPLGNTFFYVGSTGILLQELVAPFVFTWFLVNIALKRQTFLILRFENLFILLYCAWVGFVFYINPVGLSLFGASSGGFRFYVDIAISLCAYLVISNQTISEKDSFWIIVCIIGGTFIALFQTIFFYVRYGAIIGAEGSDYTWQQSMAGPALAITIYIVSKYSWNRILSISKLYLLFTLIACVAITLFSGKRSATAYILMTPILSGYIRKDYVRVFGVVILSALTIFILVLGHGRMFTLPIQIQRSLANLPGDWDYEIKNITAEGGDTFRTTLWQIAYAKIRANPILGSGFEVSGSALSAASNAIGVDQIEIEKLAVGSSWHSLWIGISADFGIPAAVIFGLFLIQGVLIALKLCRRKSLGPRQSIVAIMSFLYLMQTVFSSYSGGHSAYTPLNIWWIYAIVVGLKYTAPEGKRLEKSKGSISSESPLTLPAS